PETPRPRPQTTARFPAGRSRAPRRDKARTSRGCPALAWPRRSDPTRTASRGDRWRPGRSAAGGEFDRRTSAATAPSETPGLTRCDGRRRAWRTAPPGAARKQEAFVVLVHQGAFARHHVHRVHVVVEGHPVVEKNQDDLGLLGARAQQLRS